MKDMSYRDKMVILIISIIIIMVAGFFALIKPAYDKLVTDTATYEQTKTEWEGIKAKLDAIPELKTTITNTYEKAKKDVSIFKNTAFGDVDKEYDTKKVNYGLDQYLHQAIDDNSLKVNSFSLGETGSTTISYYYYTPDAVTYALLEQGDLNGKYAMEISDLMETSALLGERETADVLANDVKMSVTGKKEDLMNFLDTLKDDKNAINMYSLSIPDYNFKEGTEREVADEEGNVTIVANPNAEGEATLSMGMLFYNAKEIDKPDLGD